ncbi:hypothetical protein GCK72_022850 [Caenorhabditis remanei]|uniref:Target of rapamycin complex subunit lst8 n=1 Tax=Caenorhabditis remanei TaxID=31234 RepID=A0A6A5FV54_CAERE|nr:hypothetical protein GCK72_022850 [Caenorhabditis remanei]KAF1746396.1 hypothetical protein GCK72_022850 [Caenorhabditis remanei]
MLASASYDRTIRIWSLRTGKCVKFIDYQISQINTMNFTGTGRDLVVGSFQRADLFDINSGFTPKATVQVPKNVTAVGFEKNGRWMYTGGEEGTCRLWEMRSGRMIVVCALSLKTHVLSMAVNTNQTELFVSTACGRSSSGTSA